MEQLIKDYINDVHHLFLDAQASDLGGQQLNFFAGLKKASEIIVNASQAGKKVIFIGNGGSAAIASHKSLDYWYTGKIKSISFNDSSLLTCMANDLGYNHVFSKPLSMFADSGDVLVSISSSGNSENIILASEECRRRGCHIITLTGFESNNRLRRLGDLNFYVSINHFNKVEALHTLFCDIILELAMARRN